MYNTLLINIHALPDPNTITSLSFIVPSPGTVDSSQLHNLLVDEEIDIVATNRLLDESSFLEDAASELRPVISEAKPSTT